MTDGQMDRQMRVIWDAVQLTSSIQKHDTVLSENMLHKINKKRRINFQVSKGKIQTFQKFSLRKFLKFPTVPQKI